MKIYIITLLFIISISHANEKVTLQLKWKHQFQFAGYYAAKEKGFYKDVGLDVEIKERDLRYNNITQVIDGDAEYGISDSVLLLYAAKKQPVKIIAPIFQHSPGVIITLKTSGIDSPYKLNDKKLSFYKKDTDGFSILAMLNSINVNPSIDRMRGTRDYKRLLNKETDSYACYLTNEPHYFKQMGIDINIINPAHYGFDLYGDMLFTSVNEAKNHPLRVEKFKEATLKGWSYALKNKEEIIRLIKRKYSVDKSIEHLKYEADATEQMIQSKSIPLGTLDKGRIEYALNLYKKYGLIEGNIPVDDYVFESFKTELSLTEEENSYLREKGSIKMCIDPDWMPFEKNENGQHIGMTSDYFKLLEEQLNIPIKIVNTKTWMQSIEYGKQRKCDIFSLVMPTKERLKYLDFTQPYLKIPLVIVTNTNEFFIDEINHVVDKKIGIVKGYAYGEILREKYPKMQFIDVSTLNNGLEMVNNGDIYGFIGTLATIGYQIQKNYMGQLKIAGKFNEKWELGIGTRNDEPILKSIFDKAISGISVKKHHEIFNKWISVNYQNEINYLQLFKWFGGLIGIFLVILWIIIKANRKLNIEIQSRKNIEKKLHKHIDLVDENIILSTSDLSGKIVSVSRAFCKVSGYKKEELIGNSYRILKDKNRNPNIYVELWETIASDKIWNGEFKNRKKDGSIYWIESTITPIYGIDGIKIGYTSISHDITNEKVIEKLSVTDELTALYNRRYFNDIFPRELNRSKRDCRQISFLMLDVDHFKNYNDTYGHQDGDEVLKKIGKALKDSTKRASDFLFRLGGEEFGIIFSDESFDESFRFAEKLVRNIAALEIEHTKNEGLGIVTISIGLIYCSCPENITIDELYKKADENLYLAKDRGRNLVVATNEDNG